MPEEAPKIITKRSLSFIPTSGKLDGDVLRQIDIDASPFIDKCDGEVVVQPDDNGGIRVSCVKRKKVADIPTDPPI
jgi:hypothetical protein